MGLTIICFHDYTQEREMRNNVLIGLLFVMLAVPANAQTLTDREEDRVALHSFYVLAIQSFGWKCSQAEGSGYGRTPIIAGVGNVLMIEKITCENNLTYYIRSTLEETTNRVKTKRWTFCHKGTCKKFE